MALTEEERLALDGIKAMLTEDVRLGLSIHDKDPYNKEFDAERGYQHLHGHIQDLFHVKAAELTHSDGVCQAFTKVHGYKYIDDTTFKTAMQKEMVAQGIPEADREKALDIVDKIIDTLKNDEISAEKDSGFNPNLDEVIEASQPEQPNEFNIEDDDGYMEGNVMSKVGEASPGHTPDGAANRL